MERVLALKVLRPYMLELTFTSGRRACIDLEAELYGPIFEPLRDPARFAEARVDPVLKTVVWPNGADFSPEFLAEAASTPASDQV